MNILLDLGTHYGQGLREFVQRFNVDETWMTHTFEANPVTYGIFVENFQKHTPWVVAHNKAITDHNGVITVNIETPPGEGETGMGTSIIGLDKWNPWGGTLRENFKTSAEVPCIDFSGFLKENTDSKDRIIVKMDIEGSEYDTLEKMIKDGTIHRIEHISVEWHSRFFTNPEEILVRERIIVDAIQKAGVQLESWK